MNEELMEALEELEYMKTHLDEYPSFDNWEELKESLMEDD